MQNSKQKLFIICFVCLTLLTGCLSDSSNNASVAGVVMSSDQTGMASWYGDQYHGRRTASGEVFDMNELTAAHKTIAFGTLVEVRNLKNGRKVKVKINDRGPFGKNRIIDVSKRAAIELGMVDAGVAEVSIKVVS